MQIIVTYESDVANAPIGFKACVNAACQYLDALLTSPITVTIGVGYGTVAGQPMDSGALGESSGNFLSASYSQAAAALQALGTAGSSTLPAASPASGTLVVSPALECVGRWLCRVLHQRALRLRPDSVAGHSLRRLRLHGHGRA